MQHALGLGGDVTRRVLLFFFVLVCVLGLSNCGGGNGGGVQLVPPPPLLPAPQLPTTFLYAANSDSNNISGYKIDFPTGTLTAVPGSPFPAVDAPTSMALSPGSPYLVAGVFSGSKLLTFRFATSTGTLNPVASMPFGSGAPSHLVFTRENRFLYSTDVFSGNIAAFSLNDSTGTLTPVAGSPFSGSLPQLTALAINVFDTRLYAAGTGIAVYNVDDTTGALTEIPGSPFHVGRLSSDRHSLTLHVSSPFLYVTDPSAGVVRAFALAPSGAVEAEIPGSPFTAGTAPTSIAFNNLGSFAYVSNRDSGDVTTFSVDSSTGALQPVATVAAGMEPSSLLVANVGASVYVANKTSGNISGYAINLSTGALTPIPGTPFSSGNGTIFLVTTHDR